MATFKVSNPGQFDFSKPEGWQKYIQRFERFRRASGLIDKDGTIQVNTLIYCMGARPTRYFPLSNYQTIIRRNLMLLRRSLMDISSRNGMTFSIGPNSTSEDKMRVSLWTTS